jgi:hypothetical protein
MTNEEITNRLLERIALALEKIAGVEEPKQKIALTTGRQMGKTTQTQGHAIQFLIKSYIDFWRLRYRTSARPDISKATGVFKVLLASYSADQLRELLEVYVQMDDKWFATKRHDLATFREHVGKVALARDKGLNSTDVNWGRIFDNGRENVPTTDRALEGDVRRGEGLPRGKGQALLAYPRKDP